MRKFDMTVVALEYYGSGVAVAFVPAVHITPFALL